MTQSQSKASPAAKPCPICGKQPSPEHAPFCSTRCKDRDLVAWLNDSYRIPVPEREEEDY